jgi:hypothetical protein
VLLQKILAPLPDRERVVIILRYLEVIPGHSLSPDSKNPEFHGKSCPAESAAGLAFD